MFVLKKQIVSYNAYKENVRSDITCPAQRTYHRRIEAGWRTAGRRGKAGHGRAAVGAGSRQNSSPRGQSLVRSKASKTHVLNDSSEARTSEIHLEDRTEEGGWDFLRRTKNPHLPPSRHEERRTPPIFHLLGWKNGRITPPGTSSSDPLPHPCHQLPSARMPPKGFRGVFKPNPKPFPGGVEPETRKGFRFGLKGDFKPPL